jgi:hypothetical protein
LSPAIFSFKSSKVSALKNELEENDKKNQFENYDKTFFKKFNSFLKNLQNRKIVFVNDEQYTDHFFDTNLEKSIKNNSSFIKFCKITDKNIESLVRTLVKFTKTDKLIDVKGLVERSKGSIYLLLVNLACRIPNDAKLDSEKLSNIEEISKERAPRSKKGEKGKTKEKEDIYDENSFQLFHFLGKFCYNKSSI